MSELKKCPFCGGEAQISEEGFINGHFVFCTQCHIQTKLYTMGDTTERAIKDWNSRKPVERVLKRLETEQELAEKDMAECTFKGMPYYDNAKGYATGIYNAIEIIKEEVGQIEETHN